MSNPKTNDQRKARVKYIKKLMENGDPRSFNAIDAQLELVNWSESNKPLSLSGFGRIFNNRKKTPGRKIQVVHLKTGGSKQIRTNV